MQSQPLNKKQMKTLLNSKLINSRDKALLTIGFYTGYRIAELTSLKINDVAHISDNGTIKINDSVTVDSSKMKNNVTRTIEICPALKKFLHRYITGMISKGFDLFTPLLNSQYNNGSVAISRMTANRIIKKVVGLVLSIHHNISTHTMRKSFACLIYLSNNQDIMIVKAMLGHKSIKTTGIYLNDIIAMVQVKIISIT